MPSSGPARRPPLPLVCPLTLRWIGEGGPERNRVPALSCPDVKLSVVIPALDEAEHIEAAVSSALPEAAESAGSEVEVIVVDGGSRDATRARAAAAGARVLEGEPGRAGQLDLGARHSAGDALLFLHADTRLPRGWSAAVREALADEATVGGAFRFGFDARSPALRLVEWGARLRNRLAALPYGDQGLFVRRRVLDAIGGVPQTPILEDVELVVAMKRRGRLALLPHVATTSARRYLDRGPLRTMLRHWWITALWSLGVSRERIARSVRR